MERSSLRRSEGSFTKRRCALSTRRRSAKWASTVRSRIHGTSCTTLLTSPRQSCVSISSGRSAMTSTANLRMGMPSSGQLTTFSKPSFAEPGRREIARQVIRAATRMAWRSCEQVQCQMMMTVLQTGAPLGWARVTSTSCSMLMVRWAFSLAFGRMKPCRTGRSGRSALRWKALPALLPLVSSRRLKRLKRVLQPTAAMMARKTSWPSPTSRPSARGRGE
mmetsp:Transcript_94276/g.167645  ORF Transcript_94276/g.167645 Transcript_94276/m.167645 type:complete len:220 (+) Transcript_94276:264-923(+)